MTKKHERTTKAIHNAGFSAKLKDYAGNEN